MQLLFSWFAAGVDLVAWLVLTPLAAGAFILAAVWGGAVVRRPAPQAGMMDAADMESDLARSRMLAKANLWLIGVNTLLGVFAANNIAPGYMTTSHHESTAFIVVVGAADAILLAIIVTYVRGVRLASRHGAAAASDQAGFIRQWAWFAPLLAWALWLVVVCLFILGAGPLVPSGASW